MPQLPPVEIEVTGEEVLKALRRGRTPSPDMLKQAEKAVETARSLWQPAGVYEWFSVSALNGATVDIHHKNSSRTATLKVGFHSDLLQHADRVMISIFTIGNALDDTVHRLNQEGAYLESYLLDSVGVVGLGKVGEAVRRMAETAAAERDWGVSANLSPGSLKGWDISGQQTLCGLLPVRDVGISITPEHLLKPFKSVTSVIGMGPNYTARKVGSVCRFCHNAPTCWRRKDDVPEES